jgi:hypothetical protein
MTAFGPISAGHDGLKPTQSCLSRPAEIGQKRPLNGVYSGIHLLTDLGLGHRSVYETRGDALSGGS